MDLMHRLEQYRSEEEKLAWKGRFGEYFDLVTSNPHVCQLSHARLSNMILQAGYEAGPDGAKTYNFFSRDLFGLDKTLQQLVEYFNSAARRLEVRKRILLLMGPVGGGKSTIVTLLKRGLEEYSRSPEGAVYAIKGCPMHEEPLHLVPDALRPDIFKEYGIYIEGDLCPVCRQALHDTYNNRIEDVMVGRVTFSEKKRIGIGTFTPSDPKSQDISEPTGSIDLSTIGEYGVESDPRAYRFDGEMNIANRGLMEFIEMLKCDEKFLYGLLTLSQEQSIKTGRFSMIYADEVIASHTNETEYNSFVTNKKSEALQDRIIVIRVPYNLRISDEVKIYGKLLAESALKMALSSTRVLAVKNANACSTLSRKRAKNTTRWQSSTCNAPSCTRLRSLRASWSPVQLPFPRAIEGSDREEAILGSEGRGGLDPMRWTVSLSRQDWSLHRKGLIDQARHSEKVKEAIKGNLPSIISEEAIITSDGNKVVKVPIRSLDLPHFRYDFGRNKPISGWSHFPFILKWFPRVSCTSSGRMACPVGSHLETVLNGKGIVLTFDGEKNAKRVL